MPSHNPECTHGGAHGPSECRDRFARHLKPLEDPILVPEAGNVSAEEYSVGKQPQAGSGLTEADRAALRVALAGLSGTGDVPAAT